MERVIARARRAAADVWSDTWWLLAAAVLCVAVMGCTPKRVFSEPDVLEDGRAVEGLPGSENA